MTKASTFNPALIRLQNGLGFEEADLAENEAGKLSANQRGVQYRRLLRASLVFWLIFIVLGAFIAVGVYVAVPLELTLILVVIMVVACGWLGYPLVVRWLDIRRGVVEMISGKLQTAVEGQEIAVRNSLEIKELHEEFLPDSVTNKYHVVYINGVTFKVSQRIALSFRSQMGYTVYYLPRSKTIVAAREHENPA
ncbi:MAG: hypothetical protein RLP44_23235 [Aggregatilineales bacterium]